MTDAATLPAPNWGIVQWQDSGLWRRRWRFDPSSPSQSPPVKSATPGKSPGVFHFFNHRTMRRAIRQIIQGFAPLTPPPAGNMKLQSKNYKYPCHSERSAASLRISAALKERFLAALRMTKRIYDGSLVSILFSECPLNWRRSPAGVGAGLKPAPSKL